MAPKKTSREHGTDSNDRSRKAAKHAQDKDVTSSLQAQKNSRPVRSNAGQGGQRVQLEKVVGSIRPDLNPENARSARAHKQAFPDNPRENVLAPAEKVKGRRKPAATAHKPQGASTLPQNNKDIHANYPRPCIPETPLRDPPMPSAQMSQPGSQFGFQANRNTAMHTSQTPQDKQTMRSGSGTSENRMSQTQIGHTLGSQSRTLDRPATTYNADNDQNPFAESTAQFYHRNTEQGHPGALGLSVANDGSLDGQRHSSNMDTWFGSNMDALHIGTNSQDQSQQRGESSTTGTHHEVSTMQNQNQPQLRSNETWNFVGYNGGHEVGIDMDKDSHISSGISDSDADGDADADGDVDADEELTTGNSGTIIGGLDIDEASPSEDEAIALAALHAPSLGRDENGSKSDQDEHDSDNDIYVQSEGEDVVEKHRRQNHAKQPPSSRSLKQALARQEDHRNSNTMAGSSTGNIEADSSGDDEGHTEKKRARRHSKKKHVGYKPNNLGFYPPEWVTVLVKAQQRWYRHLILGRSDPFPQIDALREAEHLLTRVIAEHLDAGELLDDGMGSIKNLAQVSDLVVEYRRTREMDKCVFDSHSGWRKKLKDISAKIVAQTFSDELRDTLEAPGQLDAAELIRRRIKSMLKDNSFHIYGTDAEGRTNNMSHPSIERIILTFFYTGNKSLAALFPEDFQHSVPDHAVALVLTTIHHCLSEWTQYAFEPQNLEMRGKEYRKVFLSLMDAIDSIKADNYHCGKYEANKIRWARKGMERLRGNKNSKDGSERVVVRIVLD